MKKKLGRRKNQKLKTEVWGEAQEWGRRGRVGSEGEKRGRAVGGEEKGGRGKCRAPKKGGEAISLCRGGRRKYWSSVEEKGVLCIKPRE